MPIKNITCFDTEWVKFISEIFASPINRPDNDNEILASCAWLTNVGYFPTVISFITFFILGDTSQAILDAKSLNS